MAGLGADYAVCECRCAWPLPLLSSVFKHCMGKFVEKSQRGVELPLGCKDLIDLEEIRNWRPPIYRYWPQATTDRLAYIEGSVAQFLQFERSSKLVVISRHLNQGQIMVISYSRLSGSILFPSCQH